MQALGKYRQATILSGDFEPLLYHLRLMPNAATGNLRKTPSAGCCHQGRCSGHHSRRVRMIRPSVRTNRMNTRVDPHPPLGRKRDGFRAERDLILFLFLRRKP
jgi:hypothetical protein